MAVTTASQVDATAIRPFTIETPEAEVEDLRARIRATRFPEKETVADASQGVQLATMRALMRYWGTEYDLRSVETRLNALPQFLTEIDDLDIHFIHVKSRHADALPMILIHGWPGSVVEMLNVVGPLTDPTAHQGRVEDAFDVVIPSIPGYGYSGKPTAKGWGPDRVARASLELMKRLGYTRFVAQGGDWGAVIVDLMGAQSPPELLAIHSNMPGILPPEIASRFAPVNVAPAPAGLSAEEQRCYDDVSDVYTKGIGYAIQMLLRPQTLYGIADSPAGLAAWMIDHDARSYDDITRAFVDGAPVGNLTRDEVLDNITLTWFTNTGISSARLYHENAFGFFDAKGVSTVPVAVSVFPRELYQAPRSWTERAYPNLIHYNVLDRGDHFAAWQEPQLFSEELRAAFRSVR
ncbi:epoxide hydrolase family protein [Solirubrobacter soli]|uniref:epoxide hydrolase family protein n=1 Tax=Solirubrobacter soli TaxID=363832 RepID=UPI0009FE9527|nr:epoxide hydrolase [Solirubrobacter soli]